MKRNFLKSCISHNFGAYDFTCEIIESELNPHSCWCGIDYINFFGKIFFANLPRWPMEHPPALPITKSTTSPAYPQGTSHSSTPACLCLLNLSFSSSGFWSLGFHSRGLFSETFIAKGTPFNVIRAWPDLAIVVWTQLVPGLKGEKYNWQVLSIPSPGNSNVCPGFGFEMGWDILENVQWK